MTSEKGKGQRWWLLLVVAGALALRLYRINWESAWFDENFSLGAAYSSFGTMMAIIIRDAVHPPLHYFALWGWVRLFGFDQIQSRLLSTLFGVLSVPLIFLVGRRLRNSRVGLIAALLLAVSQFAVHQSQEGRMYAMGFFLVLCVQLSFLRALQEQRKKDWLLFLLFSVLMLYTSYYTVTILLALAVFAFARRRENPLPRRWLVATPLILALVLLPWLSEIVPVIAARRILEREPGLLRFAWTTPISSLNWFNSGKWNGMDSQSPWWSIPAGLLLFTWPAVLGLAPVRRRLSFTREVSQAPGSGLLLMLLWGLPMLIVWLISWTTHAQFAARYVFFGMAGYLLLVSFGLDSLRPVILRRMALAAAVAYSTASLYAVYTIRFKGDYRGASHYVVERFQPGDCVCFVPRRVREDVPSYWQVQAGSLVIAPRVSLDQLAAGNYPCSRVWMIRDTWFPDTGRRETARLVAESARNNDIQHLQKFFELDVILHSPIRRSRQ